MTRFISAPNRQYQVDCATNVTLAPGQHLDCASNVALDAQGTYTLGWKYQLPDGTWVNEGLPSDRTFTVDPPPTTAADVLLIPGVFTSDTFVGGSVHLTYGVKNVSNRPIALVTGVDRNAYQIAQSTSCAGQNYVYGVGVVILPGQVYTCDYSTTLLSAGHLELRAFAYWLLLKADGTKEFVGSDDLFSARPPLASVDVTPAPVLPPTLSAVSYGQDNESDVVGGSVRVTYTAVNPSSTPLAAVSAYVRVLKPDHVERRLPCPGFTNPADVAGHATVTCQVTVPFDQGGDHVIGFAYAAAGATTVTDLFPSTSVTVAGAPTPAAGSPGAGGAPTTGETPAQGGGTSPVDVPPTRPVPATPGPAASASSDLVSTPVAPQPSAAQWAAFVAFVRALQWQRFVAWVRVLFARGICRQTRSHGKVVTVCRR